MIKADILKQNVTELVRVHPYLKDFFVSLSINLPEQPVPLDVFLTSQSSEHLAEFGIDVEALTGQCLDFIFHMQKLEEQQRESIRKITVRAGFDKDGNPEQQDLEFSAGEVICVVGPTGSGKSQLLSDIECLAQRDTPSGRQVLLDDRVPDDTLRFSGEQQLIAQLSQNMNFVVDLTVGEFIRMHGESRLVRNIDNIVTQVFSTAVDLAGEPFSLETHVTALSGGQSRALMIADVACLSISPIVLIDEIENAGVDRIRALELLVKKEKIVLMATHDPLLALSGNKRLVIRNGGVAAVITTSKEERAGITHLKAMDRQIALLRDQVRRGERVTVNYPVPPLK